MATFGYNQAETLEKLERLTQLETVVAEQRIRMEKYRTMYETLKAEHSQSEDSLARKHDEISRVKEDMINMEAKFNKALEQVKSERDSKIQECEELRVQILTPQRIEVMKTKMQEEIEKPYEQKLKTLEFENDRYRETFNRVRYDYSFLKSEYEHEQAQHKSVMDELKTQHHLEIDSLVKEKESLLQRLKMEESSVDSQKMRSLQRDNSQLTMKVRSLLAELDGIREQRETAGLQSDHVSRLQVRQMNELSARCKTLEAENETLKLQNTKLQVEHDKVLKDQEDLAGKLCKQERENLSLANQISELNHTHKLEIGNLRLESAKDKGELERERDSLRQEIANAKSKVQILEQSIEHLKNGLGEKEQDAVRRIQAAQEAEWGKLSNLEAVKIQLESQVMELEKIQSSQQDNHKRQVDNFQEQIRQLQVENGKYEKELNQRKTQQSQQSALKRELEEEQARHQEMKRRTKDLQTEIETRLTQEQELKNQVEKLKDTISVLKNELSATRIQSNSNMDNLAKEFQDQQLKWEEERQRNSQKVEEQQNQIKNLKKAEDKLKTLARRRDGKRKQEIQDLTEQVALLKAKEEKLEAEKNAMEKSMSLEHDRTKRRFEKLRRGHVHFNRVLNVGGTGVPDMTLFNTTGLFGSTMAERPQKTSPLLHADLDPDPFSASIVEEDN